MKSFANKKILLIALLSLLTITACGGEEVQSSDPGTNPSKEEIQEVNEVKPSQESAEARDNSSSEDEPEENENDNPEENAE